MGRGWRELQGPLWGATAPLTTASSAWHSFLPPLSHAHLSSPPNRLYASRGAMKEEAFGERWRKAESLLPALPPWGPLGISQNPRSSELSGPASTRLPEYTLPAALREAEALAK